MRKKSALDVHKKRYGQYFSGAKVADLLTSLLPRDAVIESAIDPMAGVGDLLCPILPKVKNILAIEIDAPIAVRCAENLPTSRVLNEDAFSCAEAITPYGWDLVITNPPYVRYQLQGDVDGTIDSSKGIRKKLCKQIENLQHLTVEDKILLLRLAKNYSGLSDMAVPSWILCAALVKMGGLLAIVVPDTWLSREYAAPVQYMLTKCFDILAIVKDISACWFEGALVRTCLVVARRRSTLRLSDVSDDTLCLDIESSLIGENSLIDGMQYDGKTGKDALFSLLETRECVCGVGYVAKRKSVSNLFPQMLISAGTDKWILPEDIKATGARAFHPADMFSLIESSGYLGEFITLSDFQIKCGQGLRTGANDFFYLDIQKQVQDKYLVASKSWMDTSSEMAIPLHNIIKTLQNRSQVKGLVTSASDLSTGLLFIQDEARSEDISSCAENTHYIILNDIVSEYITAAEKFRNPHGLAFKDYSAVKPNEHMIDKKYTRFWYMLPALTPRHLPPLCMTRVNSTQTECIFVLQADDVPIAVDANFVTMWSNKPQYIKAVFALLNSTWSRCYLETLCTVMGGGALKLEAAHLKKIQFPKYSKAEVEELEKIGEELIQKGAIDCELQMRIDKATLKPFPNSRKMLQQLNALFRRRLEERGVEQ